jgi:hypothetical protein
MGRVGCIRPVPELLCFKLYKNIMDKDLEAVEEG